MESFFFFFLWVAGICSQTRVTLTAAATTLEDSLLSGHQTLIGFELSWQYRYGCSRWPFYTEEMLRVPGEGSIRLWQNVVDTAEEMTGNDATCSDMRRLGRPSGQDQPKSTCEPMAEGQS